MSQIKELKKFIEERKPSEITFWSENQEQYNIADPCKLRLSFKSMLIFENPNVICLKDGNNSVCFDRVKEVKYSDDSSPLGTIITIICGKASDFRQNCKYKLVIS